MWLKNLLMVFVLIFYSAASYKLINKKMQHKTVEGDMLLTDTQYKLIFSKPSTRNALLLENFHWPNGIVYYKFGSKIACWRKNLILDAMAKISERSCIHFMVAPENSTGYVNIINPKVGSCNAAVGYQRIVQTLKLPNKCFRFGVIQHELLHTLGFFHQQSDPNRDKYILINYKNIKEGREGNFQKYSATMVGNLLTDYDYSSVMHYGPYHFSKNGEPTIETLQSGVVIGQRVGLSDMDFVKLNLLYKCENQTRISVNKRTRIKYK